ncbi:MAG: glycoside hydrolase family 26 protein [candidate division KSB1 bacterium]|nr:glycoside hydrolase family 26 protein [candidate division KSB1 bacterium]
MNLTQITFWLVGGFLYLEASLLFGSDGSIQPVTPNPSPEAVNLLQYLYGISGKHTLTGQHCNPLVGSTRLAGVHKQTGHYPAVFGQDFGFSAPGTWDGINFRQQIVDEAIRRHHEGFIITLMWHAVRPTEDEPVTFRESVQGDLTDQQWQALITPGTEIHERWKSQVDVIAWFLKQLREAGVPVLWRPYHEMNGDWFWWGKKSGDNGYKKLYRMLFERLVHFHGLNNLIWVYNANEVKDNVDSYEKYFPGHDIVDILATDVYTEGFNQKNYDELLALAGDKPIALGEVGMIPTPEILRSQPRWVWFMSWGDPSGFWREWKTFLTTYESDEALTLEELPWVKITQPKIHYPILK